MRFRARFVRGCVGVVVFAAVLELCARFDDSLTYGAPVWGVYNAETLYERDAIGKRGIPHARFRKWRLNSLGFRGPELDTIRTTIVCFGASETFGLYEREGSEYPRRLERELNERVGTGRFQVLNAAYPGESLRSSALRVAEIVGSAHPVAALVYGVPANYIWLPYLDVEPQLPGPIVQPWFEVRIRERIRNILKATLPPRLQNWLREREIRSDPAARHAVDRLPEENIRRYRDDLLAMAAALRARGVLPILVTHFHAFGDNLSEEDRWLLTGWRKYYPMLMQDGFLDMERRANAAMRALAAEQNTPLIDLSKAVPPTSQYFADFAHLTDAGAAVVGEKLADGLLPILGADRGTSPNAARTVSGQNVGPGRH
jgi:lysophospholipase L1-like esterase